MADSREPTEREQFWLDHEAALAASGQTAKDYASQQGLSLQALYQARKRLRADGLMPKARASQGSSKSKPKRVSFSQIKLTAPPTAHADFRLRLPNGLCLEWSGGQLPTPVIELVERLTKLR